MKKMRQTQAKDLTVGQKIYAYGLPKMIGENAYIYEITEKTTLEDGRIKLEISDEYYCGDDGTITRDPEQMVWIRKKLLIKPYKPSMFTLVNKETTKKYEERMAKYEEEMIIYNKYKDNTSYTQDYDLQKYLIDIWCEQYNMKIVDNDEKLSDQYFI